MTFTKELGETASLQNVDFFPKKRPEFSNVTVTRCWLFPHTVDGGEDGPMA